MLLYLIFKKFEAKNALTKFLKYKFVNQVYENVSMIFYSIITVVVFQASATLTST